MCTIRIYNCYIKTESVVVTMLTLPPSVALKTTGGAVNDHKVGIMTTLFSVSEPPVIKHDNIFTLTLHHSGQGVLSWSVSPVRPSVCLSAPWHNWMALQAIMSPVHDSYLEPWLIDCWWTRLLAHVASSEEWWPWLITHCQLGDAVLISNV